MKEGWSKCLQLDPLTEKLVNLARLIRPCTWDRIVQSNLDLKNLGF